MKHTYQTLIAIFIYSIAFTPVLTSAQELDKFDEACLASDDNDIAATALACASALQSYASNSTSAPAKILKRIASFKKDGDLHKDLRSTILEKMRLNRRAFQSEKVLNRYGENRSMLEDHAQLFQQCGLPRDGDNHPLPQYPHSFSNPEHGIKADYNESKGVLGCLNTKSGLAGVRAEPLTQHYYCTLPGNSPEIRSCFTFQIRVSSNTRSNAHKNIMVEDESNGDVRVIERARKEWLFAGNQQDYRAAKDNKAIPLTIINKVATYCSVDGRAARVKDLTQDPPVSYWHTSFLENYLQEVESHQDPAKTNDGVITDYLQAKDSGTALLNIDQIDPVRNEESDTKPPLCWINSSQASVFQLMLSPALNLYFDRSDQLSIIKQYYQCDNQNVLQQYQRSQKKKKLYCPKNLDNWNG